MRLLRGWAVATMMVGCAHPSLLSPAPPCLQESRAGHSIERSLAGTSISPATEEHVLASDSRSRQSEALSRRLSAGSFVAYSAPFGVLLTAIPLLSTTNGST